LSVRRLRELAQAGRITGHRRTDPVTQREATFFLAADIDRLRAELRPDPLQARAQLALPAPEESPDPAVPAVPWLTLRQAAAYTGLPVGALREWVLSGELAGRDVGQREGGRYRVCRADLDALRGVDLG
jgi:excisionase family DNA binding protein